MSTGQRVSGQTILAALEAREKEDQSLMGADHGVALGPSQSSGKALYGMFVETNHVLRNCTETSWRHSSQADPVQEVWIRLNSSSCGLAARTWSERVSTW